MPTTCQHGFPADSCIICSTLAAGRPSTTQAPPAVRPPVGQPGGWSPDLPQGGRASSPGGRSGGDPVRSGRRLATTSAVLTVLAVIAVVGIVWAVAGAVFAVLRLVELFAGIVVAGWVGYRIGVARGRRER